MKSTRSSLSAPFFAAALLSFMSVSAFAWSGGPFKAGPGAHKSYEGTWKASVVGRNLMGVISVQNAASAGSGTAVVFADGIVYTGTATLAIDPARNKVAGVFAGTGSRRATSQRSGDSETYSFSTGSVNGTSTGTSQTLAEMFYTANSSVANNGTLSGAFMGTIKSKGGYSLIFSGRGSASVDVNNADSTVTRFVTIPVRVAGSRVSFPSATAAPAPAP